MNARQDVTDWEGKYKELDESWRKKYTERFFEGGSDEDGSFIEDVNDIDNPWIQGLSTSLGTEHDISYSRRNNYFVVYAAVDLINFMYTKEFYDETKRVVSVRVV